MTPDEIRQAHETAFENGRQQGLEKMVDDVATVLGHLSRHPMLRTRLSEEEKVSAAVQLTAGLWAGLE